MMPTNASSPVSLSYVAALRGFVPRWPGTSFTYAIANCQKPSLLICLAASNPEGRFYGFMTDARARAQAEALASAQSVDNVSFLQTTSGGVLQQAGSFLPPLNYLCVDESETPLTPSARATLFDTAKDCLAPGGVFHYTYRAYSDDTGSLRFLVREFAPEMNADQANGFLHEIKTLGRAYLANHPETVAKLDDAIERKMPDLFFGDYDEGDGHSGAFDTIVSLRPRGFTYAGDSRIAENYIDFQVSPEAQDIIFSCRDNHLYEAIKDFTLNRTLRSDIWCREPAPRTTNAAELFGGFSYGIVMPIENIPSEIKTQGATVDLSSPLFTKLKELLTVMPVSIGDFLAHPDGQGLTTPDVVNALQVLVACNIAQPMRGMYHTGNFTSVAQPRFAGTFNKILGHKELAPGEILFASPVLGGAVSVSPREVLVMQALDRAGLAGSVSALLPELERLAKNPALSAYVSDLAEPTTTSAHAMIEDTVSRSIVQWYAYGLLEAA